MPDHSADAPTRRLCPIILVRGFGGLSVEDERQEAYQGFNDGTVYPQKRGENYVYEGFVLRLLKSDWKYRDATNVVGFFPTPIGKALGIPKELEKLDRGFFEDSDVVIDPGMAMALLAEPAGDPRQSFWVFRYYDLGERRMELFARALVRLIDFVNALVELKKPGTQPAKVNIVAHSMGGLIMREAVQGIYPKLGRKAADHINKIVTLGTPHKGIVFQIFKQWAAFEAADELKAFLPPDKADKRKPSHWSKFAKSFPLDRLLCVVGTNYRTYAVRSSSALNRLFSVDGEFGATYNRSDGLVKQAYAEIDGAPRTFVHKCHGGPDSLVTSREAFEIASRFFFGDVRVRARLLKARILRGQDFFGRSEFYFGMAIKVRGVDFELFHQSAEAENCYGPFGSLDMTDPDPAFGWAGPDRLIWEGWLNSSASRGDGDLVLRADFYVGERDSFGIGFSDNVVYRKQYYLRAIPAPTFELRLYTGEEFARPETEAQYTAAQATLEGWMIQISGTGFSADIGIEFDRIPLDGIPERIRPGPKGWPEPAQPA